MLIGYAIVIAVVAVGAGALIAQYRMALTVLTIDGPATRCGWAWGWARSPNRWGRSMPATAPST